MQKDSAGNSQGSSDQGRWIVRDGPPADVVDALSGLAPAFGDLAPRLLYARGVSTTDEAQTYLRPSYSDMSDPFDWPGMETAASRVISAIEGGERIGVVGDFDVDGLSGTALLVMAIKSFGGDCVAFVPDRTYDGHGVPLQALNTMHAQGVSLVITADTGTSDHEAFQHAAELGLDAIVTDHHRLSGDPPPVHAIVNPSIPGAPDGAQHMTGAGIAFKLAQAVGRRMKHSGANDAIALASLGTIADVGPLIGENRVIVFHGLNALSKSTHAGIRSLLKRAGIGNPGEVVTSEDVAFQIAPRLNAPGRLGSAGLSLDLLVCEDHDRSEKVADEVDAANTDRRNLSREARSLANAQLSGEPAIPPFISIVSDKLLPGILGPLAGGLSADHGRPAMAATFEGDSVRASLRSVEGFDIFAALDEHAELFDRHGGHARAAGFTAPAMNLDEIVSRLTRAAANSPPPTDLPHVVADAEVGFESLIPSLWDFIESLQPFGEGNPAPVFISREVFPTEVKAVGATGAHLRVKLEGAGRQLQGVGFGLGGADLGYGLVDVAYTPKLNRWAGRVRREIEIKAIRPSSI